MSSANYELIHAAMASRLQIVCEYQGYVREICPHALGLGKAGELKVLGFQFGGHSSRGLPPGGEWRCMDIDQMRGIRSQTGEWHTHDTHGKPQSCVKELHFEVIA